MRGLVCGVLVVGMLLAGGSCVGAAESGGRYGLLESAFPGLATGVAHARAGLEACTLNDQTHAADSGHHYGRATWINDLYFGLYGGLYVYGPRQHEIYRRELAKVARYVRVSDHHPGIPYAVSMDGATPYYNPDPGMDIDRTLEFILMVSRRYEVTGDLGFVREMYPACLRALEFAKRRDVDDDGFAEGRTESFVLSGKPCGVGAAGGCTYIGDSVANEWKDFGVQMFWYDALRHLARLEDRMGLGAEASRHRQQAGELRSHINDVFWNQSSQGYLAWIDKQGVKHDDWITGNNLHAIMCGLATEAMAESILARYAAHRAELEDVVPVRVRLGLYAKGLCSSKPYMGWNGGVWPVVSAPAMIVKGNRGDLAGALHIADLLSNHTRTSDTGFYEVYNGRTGEPGKVKGLLMNNAGYLWGVFAGVFGVDMVGDEILLRGTVPVEVLPARMRLAYRGRDVEIEWKKSGAASATCNGRELPHGEDGCFHWAPGPAGKASRIVVKVAPGGRK